MLNFSKLTVSLGKRQIFSNLNGQCEGGQFVALVGENGAGKSTLLHTLAGERPYSGEVIFKNKSIDLWDIDQLATQRAVLTQHHNSAFAFAIPDIIAMGRHQLSETRQACVDKVQQYIQLMTLEGLLDRNIQQLSGGELQRVFMAKCLAQLDAFSEGSRNKLMLLDEPTSALDLRHQHRLLQIVKSFTQQGNTAIVAIHDLNLAALYADSVLLLHEGRLQAYGEPKTVFQQSILERVYRSPMHISSHPTLNHPMIFSEPQELTHEIKSFNRG
ncbi:heme ABC transporter ATP-binding protein [Aliikangiella marina]|uniref:Heme ABC transporter ATP-binding protein n=1 Tax=Aliikangiella marina TaxID=1712262 RepID=A0A545TD74_9GAMM|nr:heme ABC transporter ATP-binding protein [Aliikangiella marina]TQV75172.1 heme ABC transporter ATP-binding protein [Aliikangiella marina]